MKVQKCDESVTTAAASRIYCENLPNCRRTITKEKRSYLIITTSVSHNNDLMSNNYEKISHIHNIIMMK